MNPQLVVIWLCWHNITWIIIIIISSSSSSSSGGGSSSSSSITSFTASSVTAEDYKLKVEGGNSWHLFFKLRDWVWAYQTVSTALALLLNQGSIKRYFVHEV